MKDRFSDQIDGRNGRLLRDSSFVDWENRPSDVLENDGKTHIGWEINTYISEFLPHIHARQIDRILTPDEKRVFSMKPVAGAIFNSKGGSHKTTTAVHMAIIAAILGFRVLLVDADPQATASTLMGYPFSQYPMNSNFSLFTALSHLDEALQNGTQDQYNPLDYVRNSTFQSVSIVTGSTQGSLIDILISKRSDLVEHFITSLKESGEFDLILVDTRPQSSYQDFAQYRAADFLINTLASSTTGIGSTTQGVFNYLAHQVAVGGDIHQRKNQLSIISATCVESDPRHPSRKIYDRIFSLANNPEHPVASVDGYIPPANIIAEANSVMETVFQQTNVNVASSKTKKIIDAALKQFEDVFAKCIAPYWLKLNGAVVNKDDVLSFTGGPISDPLNRHQSEYEFLDMGFAYGVVRSKEPVMIAESIRAKRQFVVNPKRFLMGNEIGVEGHQIVMKDGVYYALNYNLDELADITPYVFRANSY